MVWEGVNGDAIAAGGGYAAMAGAYRAEVAFPGFIIVVEVIVVVVGGVFDGAGVVQGSAAIDPQRVQPTQVKGGGARTGGQPPIADIAPHRKVVADVCVGLPPLPQQRFDVHGAGSADAGDGAIVMQRHGIIAALGTDSQRRSLMM